MKRSARRLLLAVVLVLVSSTSGFAQGASQSLSGVVVDAAGGVIPGASVVVVNNATGEKFDLTSNEAGVFAVPGIAVGTYTVTVTLQSFKTAVINDVRIVTGTAANVKATLEVGALSETVQVSSRAELVQSQSPSVASTLVAEQLNEVPLASRNALYALNMLPGVQYGSGAGPRAAGINGLPNNTVNITIDGVQTGNMLQSTDGFFSMVTPRLDAVEEITITGAVPGSGSGPGSVQVQFATRSGTNRFDGSAYHYWKQPDFNSNYYFNKINSLPKNQVVAHQYGFRQGGPIVIPGLYDGRNKAFFFFNFERLYQPSSATRTRTMLRPEAQAGLFGYNVTVGGAQQRQTVDLLALARGQRPDLRARSDDGPDAGQDPLGTQSTGTINDTGAGNTLITCSRPRRVGNQYTPTGRVDINVSENHRLSGVLLVAALHQHDGPAQQRRRALPGPAELRHAELLPHHRQLDAAFDARHEHGQRTARRLAVVAERLLLEHHGGPLQRPGRLRARFPGELRAPGRPTRQRRSRATPRPGASTTR